MCRSVSAEPSADVVTKKLLQNALRHCKVITTRLSWEFCTALKLKKRIVQYIAFKQRHRIVEDILKVCVDSF